MFSWHSEIPIGGALGWVFFHSLGSEFDSPFEFGHYLSVLSISFYSFFDNFLSSISLFFLARTAVQMLELLGSTSNFLSSNVSFNPTEPYNFCCHIYYFIKALLVFCCLHCLFYGLLFLFHRCHVFSQIFEDINYNLVLLF